MLNYKLCFVHFKDVQNKDLQIMCCTFKDVQNYDLQMYDVELLSGKLYFNKLILKFEIRAI